MSLRTRGYNAYELKERGLSQDPIITVGIGGDSDEIGDCIPGTLLLTMCQAEIVSASDLRIESKSRISARDDYKNATRVPKPMSSTVIYNI